MSDRIEREGRILAGFEAKRFLDDPQYKQAVEGIEQRLFVRWRLTAADDSVLREQIWQQWHALDELQRALTEPINEGTLAEAERDQDKFQEQLG